MNSKKIRRLMLIAMAIVYVTVADAQTLGSEWEQVKREDMWPSLLSLESVDGQLLVVDGNAKAVWYSDDGISWDALTSALPSPLTATARAFHFGDRVGMTTYTGCWLSDDGYRWGKASELPSPGARVVEMASRLWAVGGQLDFSDVAGHVYSSENGVDWVNETDTAPWSVRRPNLAVHGGKLWILGGDALDVGVSPFDVWYSEDGKDWLQAPTPPWMGLARRSFSVVVFQNRLWVFGGLVTTAEDGQFASRDVWASDDGLEWELVTDSAPWYGRSDAGVTVHDGRIWLCGGSSRYGLMDDVWYTEDGVHWVNPLPPMWEKRYAHGAAVFQDEMWIMGGDNGDKRFNDVWHSADGLAWTQAADAGWAPRRGLGVAVLNDALYVAGGQDGKTEGAHYYNDVWCSEDGETWQELTAAAPWSSRGFGKLLVFQDKLWMLGGEHRGSTLRDIWSSNDGVIWSLEMDQAPWPRIQSAAAAVHKGRIYTSDGWASGDGITWEEILGRDSTYRLPILLSNAGRLWYFSGLYYIDEPEWHYNYAVRSSLGNYWEIVARNLSLTDREAAAGLVFKGSLWMLGGSGEFDRPRNDIWRSSGVPANHAADTDGDDTIGLSELLRAVQFYSLGGYACDPMGEDGYGVTTTDHHCTPHSSDYNPQDWKLNLGELLRLIQIFNIGGYYLCDDGEDGFCPGPGVGEE